VGLVGGLGAIAGFVLPWFVFVVAISMGCRAPLQIELYELGGAALALGSAGDGPAAASIAALVCAVIVVIICIASLRRPTLRRARLLLMVAVIGIGALSVVGALATRGQITPAGLTYVAYLGFGVGFWITIGGLLLSWVSGAVLHTAMRPNRKFEVAADMAFAALGIVGLLASGAIAITERPAPYPTLTCSQATSQSTASTPGASRAYFTSADGLYALDAATGRLQWRCRNPLGGIVTVGPPALAASGPIVASRDGYVYAVRAADATILWRADIGGRGRFVNQTPSIAPIVANGVIYGVNGANRLYALRASDGVSLWPSQVKPPPAAWPGTPVLLAGGALLYLANNDFRPHLTALDSQSGRLLWQTVNPLSFGYPTYPFDSAQNGAVQLGGPGVIYDEELDLPSTELFLVAHAVADGATQWRYQLTMKGDQPTPSAFTVANGAIYLETRTPAAPGVGGQVTPHVVALRARDGALLWSTAAPDGASERYGQLIQTHDAILFESGRISLTVTWSQYQPGITLYSFDARRGSVLWRDDNAYQAPPTSPPGEFSQTALVPMDGAVYLLDPFSTVERLDAQGGVVQWRRDVATATLSGGVASAALAAGAAGPGLLYVVSVQIVALDPESGAVRWRYTPETPTTPYTLQNPTSLSAVSSPTFSP
jgi:outer membrane protein assembly factor BamB